MKLRLWSIRLACVAGSFALCCVALEIGLRLFSPIPPSWLAIYDEHPRLPYALLPNAETVVDTGVTHWTVRTDGDRLRVGPGGSLPVGEPHWLVVGDSFAFGHGVDAELGLVGRLEVETGMAIANAAVPGFGPAQYRAMLNEHIDRPGLEGVLVVAYLGNDFHDAIWDKTATIHDGVLGLRAGLKGKVKRNSHLYRFASNSLHRLGFAGPNSTLTLEAELMTPSTWSGRLEAAEAVWKTAYSGMHADCEERGLPILVMLIPNRSAVDEATRAQAAARVVAQGNVPDHMLAIAKARDWIDSAGLTCLDPTETLTRMKVERFLPFDGHLTPRANAEVARAVSAGVLGELRKSE